METGYYIQTRKRGEDPEYATVTHAGPKTLFEITQDYNFLNDRLGREFHVEIVFIRVNKVWNNDA